jgi:hypothetical protein
MPNSNYRRTANLASRRLISQHAFENALMPSFSKNISSKIPASTKKSLARNVSRKIWSKITKHRIISKSLGEARKEWLKSHKKSMKKKSRSGRKN